MRIALDAMGSDAGATPLVEGAVLAAKRFGISVLLAGKQHTLRRLLRHFRYEGDLIEIVPCSEVVRMGEHPRDSLAKHDSSIAVAARLVREGRADALVSAGNSGSTLAHAMTCWRRLKGISRPGIAALMPTRKGSCLVVDVGANVDCRPRHLVDFALMGSIFMREIMARPKPRVGVLSLGEESTKGNALTLATYRLLETSHLHFVGNVQANDLFKGVADVVVCDGFVGNVLLKASEGVAKMIMTGIKGAMTSNVLSMVGALMVSPGMRSFKKKIDYSEYGGAPLLGLNGICIITHGAADSKAVMNAIRAASEAVTHQINRIIAEEVREISEEIRTVSAEIDEEEARHLPQASLQVTAP